MTETELTAMPTTPARAGEPLRFRISLGELMIWVLGAAIVAAVCREVRPASWLAPSIDVARLLGLVAVILVIFTVIGLFRQAFMGWRRWHTDGVVPCLVAVGWRLAVVAALGTALVVEVRLLGGDVMGYDWSNPKAVGLRLLPLTMTLALAGILAGLAPGRDRNHAGGRSRRLAWLSVLWAGVAGVVIASTQAVIPYLVLLAMDAVRNAMQGPIAFRPLRPDLRGRLLRAGVESAPVLACCLALALLVARDLRRRPGDPNASWRGLFTLLTATVAAGVGSAWLYTVTIPSVDEWLAEGLRVTIDPLNAALLAFGFAGLALGIAARATGRPGSPDPARTEDRPRAWFWRALGNLAIALILLDFIAARGIDLIVARRLAPDEPVDALFRHWIGWVDAAYDALLMFLRQRVQPWHSFEAPEWLALALAMAWVAWWVIRLLVTPISTEPTPIDASLADRRTLGRFAIRWAALTVLMIASLPALFLSGLVLVHVLFRAPG